MPVCRRVNAPRKTSDMSPRKNLPPDWIELKKNFDPWAI